MSKQPENASSAFSRWIYSALAVVSVAMAAYQLLFTQVLLQDSNGHQITHLGFALVVVLLSLLYKSKTKTDKIVKFILLVCSVAITGFFMIWLNEILTYRTAMPATIDLIIGALELAIIFITSYLVYGKTFPILGGFFIGYLYFGRYLPYPMTVADVPWDRILMWLSSVGSDEGAYGEILAISSNYLFLFIFFGAVLDVFGGTRCIMAIGNWAGSKVKSGPAAVAVIGSSLLGTITGSTVANITITGSFTIPMMKKAGYSPEQAGAIEAVSSSGGQIMPPVMGATAFVMAGYAGIPYIEIAKAAFLPAVIYYFGVFVFVQLLARQMNIISIPMPINARQLLLDIPIFVLPLAILTILMVIGFTLPFVCFWTIVTLVIIGLLSGIRKDINLDFRKILEGLVGGVVIASETALICAMIGIVATCIKVSGLGMKLPNLIATISQGHLIVALLLAAFSSVVLGMGLPSPVAYILVAIGAVPALREMGVSVLQAHLFCFICAVFAHITPPVAIGALVAAQIAGGDYWKTAWLAVRGAAVKFVVPFLIIYAPVLILKPKAGLFGAVLKLAIVVASVFSFQVFCSNYWMLPLKKIERVLHGLVFALGLYGVFIASYPIMLTIAALFVAIISVHTLRRGSSQRALSLGTAPG